VLTLTGLVRYFVLFVIDLQTRHVQIGGVLRQPYGAWMTQVARNLTDGVDGFLIGKRYLLHDRDPLFTDEFRGVLAAAGVKCLRLPARSPDLNSFAERFVLSIKSECLSKLVVRSRDWLDQLKRRHPLHALRTGGATCQRERAGRAPRAAGWIAQLLLPARCMSPTHFWHTTPTACTPASRSPR
jgi:hypothetical protein